MEVAIETSVTHESSHYIFGIQVPELNITAPTSTSEDLLDDLSFLDDVIIMLTLCHNNGIIMSTLGPLSILGTSRVIRD